MTGAATQSALTRETLQRLFRASRSGVEQLPALRLALEQTGVACTEEMRNAASVPLRLALESIQAGTFESAIAEGSDRVIGVFGASAWEAQLFVGADAPAVSAIVEGMLGGDGSQASLTAERPLSKLDADVAGLFFAKIASALAASFAPVAASPFGLEAHGEDVDLEGIAPEVPMVVARYRLDALERAGEVVIAIPQSAIEALRKPLAAGIPEAAPKPDPGWTQQISKEVTRASVTLTAILEERPGLLAEVFNLAVGQVIELKATPQSRVRVECNGEPMAWCDLGKSNGAYTLRVDSFIDREQEFMNDILAA